MQYDIMPFSSPLGGTTMVVPLRLGGSSTIATASTSFQVGEALLLDVSAGDVNAIADGSSNATTNHYIAAAGSEALINKFKATSGASSFTIMVPCWELMPDQEFITKNVFTSNDTLVVPSTLYVGDTVGLYRDNTAVGTGHAGVNGKMGIDSAATGLKLTRILDAHKVDTCVSGGTGVYAVFRSNVTG